MLTCSLDKHCLERVFMKIISQIKNGYYSFFLSIGLSQNPITAPQFSPDAQLIGYLWLIMGIVLLILELTTPGLFFFISFAIGCGIAALFAFLGLSFIVQSLGGLVASGIACWIMRSYFVTKKHATFKTNIDALMHQTGIVTITIEPKKAGRVKIRGEEWPAVVEEPKILQIGTSVTVIRIDGNKVIVK